MLGAMTKTGATTTRAATGAAAAGAAGSRNGSENNSAAGQQHQHQQQQQQQQQQLQQLKYCVSAPAPAPATGGEGVAAGDSSSGWSRCVSEEAGQQLQQEQQQPDLRSRSWMGPSGWGTSAGERRHPDAPLSPEGQARYSLSHAGSSRRELVDIQASAEAFQTETDVFQEQTVAYEAHTEAFKSQTASFEAHTEAFKQELAIVVVYVTVPNMDIGKMLARQVVEHKLAACVNIVSGLTSVYWWEGSVTEDDELLLIIKTRKSLLAELSIFVKANHPYDVCEVISLPVLGGNPSYLQWVLSNTRGSSSDAEAERRQQPPGGE